MMPTSPVRNSAAAVPYFQVFPIWKWIILSILIQGCAVQPRGVFDPNEVPAQPNYSLPEAWAALPSTIDPADRTPGLLSDQQETAGVDVFFLHPTSYTGKKRSDTNWNGPVYDPGLQKRTDEVSIKYQASIFNGAGRIYAPRYRQAHLHAYYTEDREESAARAFQTAYSDIKAAFEYYLAHYNQGRPIIIAAHSQGTDHAKKLIREFFDGTPRQGQLVVAYLVGMEVKADEFDFIKACGGPEETGCFCSWRTWRKGKYPSWHFPDNNIAVTNPLNWTTTSTYAPASLNEGAVLKNFEKVLPAVTDAEIHQGILWASKPRFPWSFLIFNPDYHVGDFNLYYVNVRKNAIQRAAVFLKSHTAAEEKTGE